MASKGNFCQGAKNDINGSKSIFHGKTIYIQLEDKLTYTNILHFNRSEGFGWPQTALYLSSDFYD